MSYSIMIGELRMDIVQTTDYIAGANRTVTARAALTDTLSDDGRHHITSKVTVDLGDTELSDCMPVEFLQDMGNALEDYLEASFDSSIDMGKYGILVETGGQGLPSHVYRLVMFVYGEPSNPEFRFVPMTSITRAECAAECEAEGKT